jgi:hypothetical protein
MTLYFRRGIVRSTFVALLLALVFWLLLGYTMPARAYDKTIGDGTAASCNQTNFFAAFAGGAGGSIGFNCPPNTVITLSLGYQGIITPTMLDGFNNGNPVTLSGNNTNRLFEVSANQPFTLTHITLRDGFVDYPFSGGCVVAFGQLLTQDVTFTHCVANDTNGWGGAVYLSGSGSASLSDSRVLSSSAYFGGGMYNDGGVLTLTRTYMGFNRAALGGAIFNKTGTMLLVSSTFGSNSSIEGGGGGGLYNDHGTASLSDVTFSANSADAYGGGLLNYYGIAKLTNVTLSGNSASLGGGIANFAGTATLTNLTLSGNSATIAGGGVWHVGYLVNHTITLKNSIVANSPSGGNCHQDVNSLTPLTSNNFNLSDDDSCTLYFNKASDLNGADNDPNLGPLTDNGGPTPTHLPQAPSPAIDAIPLGTNGCGTTITTDQRGAPRPINGKCDIGAVEVGWPYLRLFLPLVVR